MGAVAASCRWRISRKRTNVCLHRAIHTPVLEFSDAALVKAVGGPVNITGRPGMPDAAAFEHIGVARITIASAPTLVAMSTIQKLAADLRATGSFDTLTATLRHPDAQKLFQMKG